MALLIMVVDVTTCSIHTEFFDDLCSECKEEYNELKGNIGGKPSIQDSHSEDGSETYRAKNRNRDYKEFTEGRAKKLYGELLVQYMKKSSTEEEAARKARAIIRKQCRLRGIQFWSWIS
jgi:hypothetical protein